MTYVEWLRVRGCLKWTALVLVVAIAIVLFARFTYLDIRPHATLSGVVLGDQTFTQFERSSHETTAKLSDGTTRTVIDNPAKGLRITIDDRGYWGKHVEVRIRKPRHHEHLSTVNFGDIHFTMQQRPDAFYIVVDEGASVPEDFAYYFLMAAVTAMIVATVLGAPFARENENHLEVACTKPIAREWLAIGMIAADLAGIVAAWAMTVVFLFVGHVIFEAPNYTFGPHDAAVLAIGLLSAFAWYGMLAAASASMKRAYGAVLGCSWPVMASVNWLATADLGDSALARVAHLVGRALATINPLTYLHFGSLFVNKDFENSTAHAAATATSYFNNAPVILVILAIVYVALAVFQWRRVEA